MRKIAFLLSLVLIFIIPWEGVVRLPIGTLAKAIGLGVGAFWLATVVVMGQVRKPTPYHLMVFLFVIWNAVSVFWSASPTTTLAHVMTWIQLFLLVYILWDLYTTREAILAGLQMYVLGCYVALGGTIVNFLIGNTFYYGRYTAAGTSPDDLGAILALGIPVAWHVASQNNMTMSRLLKWVNYIYIPAALVGIALSATRLALIAAIPGIVFGLASLTQVNLSTRITIFLFLIGAAYYLLPLIPQESFQRLGTTGTEISSGDLNGRVELWHQGLVAFEEHPLLGVGSN